VRQLEEVDVTGIEPLTHPHQDRVSGTPLREDEVRAQSSADAVLACAPELVDGGFKVPPIL
jgi:aspartyl/glutamyl-tRNA(Asn/Gln) amidotransferase C subunit